MSTTIYRHILPGKLCRFVIIVNLVFCLLVCLGSSSPAKEVIKVGYALDYESETIKQEVKLAISFLLKKALSHDGVEVEFVFSDTKEETLKLLLAEKIDVAEIGGLKYAQLSAEDKESLVPCLVPQRSEEPLETYLMLAKKGTKIEHLDGGKVLSVRERYRGLSMAWMKSITRTDAFRIESCAQPSEAVIQTFFGKAAACVVSRSDFMLLSELNPQLSRELTIVVQSKPMLPLLLVQSRSSRLRVDLDRALELALQLHHSPEGQQAFTLMKLKCFARFYPQYLVETRALVEGKEVLQ